jgi:hypothetical protein
LTAKVAMPTSTLMPWWITLVYGPQEDEDKITFLQELCDMRAESDGPWMFAVISI